MRELDASALPDGGSIDHPFALDLEGEDVRWYGAVDWDDGRSMLLLRRGVAGLLHFHAEADLAFGDDVGRTREISAVSVPLAAVELRRRSVLQRAGVVTEDAADLCVGDGGGGGRFPDRSELRRLMLALRAVLAVAKDPLLAAAPPHGKIVVLTVRGDTRAPTVTVALEDEPADAVRPAPRASDEMREWPVEDGEWLVVPFDDPPEGGEPASAEILVIDRGERRLVGRSTLPSGSPDACARAFLRGRWFDDHTADPWLARNVAVADPAVADLVRGPLEALGAACTAIDRTTAERETLRVLRDVSRLQKDELDEYHEFDEQVYDDAMGEDEEGDDDDFDEEDLEEDDGRGPKP